ncbi:MAG: hypothetical protein WCR52_04665 [Bacteroidota bacterium]
MKHLKLAPLFAVLWGCLCHAQTLPQQMAYLCAPLDKSQTASGYLFDQSVPFAEPLQYDGALNSGNISDINTFGFLYGEMRSAKTAYGPDLPSPTVYLDKIKKIQYGDPYPLAVMSWRYDRIKPDAVSRNLINYSNKQLVDVAGRTENPYLQDTLVVSAPLAESVNTMTPKFTLPADLWFTNWAEYQTPQLSIDLGDGRGWQVFAIGDTVQALYATTGGKEIIIRLNYGGFSHYCHSKLNVDAPQVSLRDGGMQWPQDLHQIIPITSSKTYTDPSGITAPGKATMHIFFNTKNCPGKMLRPLILVEGYEEPGVTQSTYDRMFGLLNAKIISGNENLTDNLYPAEYDLIYVDLADGSDWIQRNAYAVEEVIKKVNEMKAAAGSTEKNVVIGVSMGGVCSKYALLDMQNNGPAHDSRLFVTYDSPLRGANIPIGTQLFMRFLKENVSDAFEGKISVPGLDLVWQAIQAPTPRQLLLYHVNAIEKDSFNVPEPINPDHTAFQTELDAMGALEIRHVALSNGAGTGTYIENNIKAGEFIFDLSGSRDTCQTTLPYNIIQCGNISFDVQISATGGTDKMIFYGKIRLEMPALTGTDVKQASDYKVSTTKPYDSAPGGSSNLGVGPLGILSSVASDFGITPSGPGLIATHHCFIPSFSSVSAPEPTNFSTPQPCGAVSRCDLSTSPSTCPYSGLPEINQPHVSIDKRIALVLIDELTTDLQPLPDHPFVINPNLSTYYNEGTPKEPLIPTVTISTNQGALHLNNTGPIGYAGSGGQDSPFEHIDVSTKCDAVITVENGARLVIGATEDNKTATLHISKGSIVHVKTGGILHIQGNSSLEIEKLGSLVLDAGAIVELFGRNDGVLMTGSPARIHVKENGLLNFEGNISFHGDGFFEFDEGHKVVFPNDFTFNGSGKQFRHFKLNTNAHLLKQGGRLAFMNAKFQIGCEAKPRIENFDRLLLNNTAFEFIEEGSCLPQPPSYTLNGDQFGFEAENGKTIFVKNSNFNNTRTGLRAHNISGDIRVESCNFKEGRAVDFYQIKYAMLKNVTGSSATFAFDEVSQSVSLDHVALTDACSICGTQEEGIVKLTDVKMLWMTGGLIEQSLGATPVLRGIDARLGENNVTMQSGATIQNTYIGVEINGGLPGHQYNTDFGLMRMDCARILNCSGPSISGEDVLLDIDAGINSNGLRPNEFRKGDIDGISMFFDICYRKRQPSEILANDNFWNITGNGGVPEPIVDYQLNRWLGGACGDPLPLVTNSVAPAYNANCPHRGGGDMGRDRDLPQPGYKDCSIGIHNLYGGFVTAWESIDSELMAADIANVAPDLSAAISAFAPLSAVDSVTLASNAPVCRHYTEVARVFTIQSAQEHDQQQQALRPANAANVTLAPNPAGDGFALNLPQGDWQVSAVDAFGRVVYQQQLTEGAQYIATAAWAEGIYTVFYRAVAEPGVFGQIKVAVAR